MTLTGIQVYKHCVLSVFLRQVINLWANPCREAAEDT